jgi:tryptophanase
VVELYREGGVRAVEIGSLMFGDNGGKPEMELVLLAIPRRVYTSAHMSYVAHVIGRIWERRESMRGLRIAWEPPMLRHFSARLEPLS